MKLIIEVPDDCFYVGTKGYKSIDLTSGQMACALCQGKEVIEVKPDGAGKLYSPSAAGKQYLYDGKPVKLWANEVEL